MNLPFIPAIIAFVRSHIIPLAVALLVALLAVGGYSGWRHYQYRQTAEFAFAQIKGALHPANVAELAVRVDFNAICQPLARAIARQYPFLKKGPDQLRLLSDMAQVALLKQARVKEEPQKEETDPLARLKTPLYVLPKTFFTQLSHSVALQHDAEKTALIAAEVHHPLLKKDFSLLLRMDKTPEGWKVCDLVNAEDLVRRFREAQVERMEAKRQLILDKNANTRKRMEGMFPIRACTASAGLISDGKTLLVVVNVTAKNTGAVAVNNMDLSVTLYDAEGKELLQRFLNAVHPTYPGDTFEKRWTIMLDGDTPLGKSVLAARGITCRAFWKTLGLNNGEILHLTGHPELVEEFQ